MNHIKTSGSFESSTLGSPALLFLHPAQWQMDFLTPWFWMPLILLLAWGRSSSLIQTSFVGRKGSSFFHSIQ